MLKNNKIKIAMLEISDQNKAILEFYFSSTGEEFYTLVGKEKADAFIADYDYPGAKADIQKTIDTTQKPVIILSIREQNIPSTIWLAKPLSASALTGAAAKLKQLISEKEERLSKEKEEVSVIPTVNSTTESVVIDEPEEVALQKSELREVLVESKAFNETEISKETEVEAKIESEEGDLFELLSEVDELDDESQDEVIERAAIRTEKLGSVSASVTSLTKSSVSTKVSDISNPSRLTALLSESELEPEEASSVNSVEEETLIATEEDSSSSLEFTDVVFDDLSLDDISDVDSELQSESEVDALLESLISGTGNSNKKKAVVETEDRDDEHKETSSDDIFIESLVLNDEPEDKVAEEVKPENGDESEIDFIDLLDDESLLEIDKDSDEEKEEIQKLIVEEKPNLLMEENFLLHDDQNPSEEGVYTETLEVDYADVKAKTKESDSTSDEGDLIEIEDVGNPSLELSLEPSDDLIQEDSVLDVVIDDDKSETGLFTFELESNESEEGEMLEVSKGLDSVENSKTPYLTVVDNSTTDLDIDLGLDSLLREVAAEGDKFIDEPEESNDETFISPEASILDEGLEKLESFDIQESFDKQDSSDSESNSSPDFELQSLLNEVREEAGKGKANGGNSEDGSYKESEAEKRWLQLCGENPAIEDQKQIATLSFDLQNHLLGILLQQVESTKKSEQLFRLKYNDLIIVIDHFKNKIYCNVPIESDDYSAVCFAELNPLDIKIHDLDYSEVRLYRSKIDQNSNRAHSIESFIWTTSLLTSQGRLPKGTDVTKIIALKVWPNLTRVELMPHAMNIAAVLSKHPSSLLDVSKGLDIHQRYVFAFYNAALSLNMIELDGSKIKKSSFKFGKKGSGKKPENRGFFGRLLKRLKS